MLLSRSLPPQFLLPACGTRKLLRALQRAQSSTIPKSRLPTPSLKTRRDTDKNNVHHGTGSLRRLSNNRTPVKKRIETTKPTISPIDDQGALPGREVPLRRGHAGGRGRSFAGDEALIRRSIKRTAFTNTVEKKPNSLFPASRRISISPTKPLGAVRTSPLEGEVSESLLNSRMKSPAETFSLERKNLKKSMPEKEQVWSSTYLSQYEPKEATSSLLADNRSQESESGVQLQNMETPGSALNDERDLRGPTRARPRRTKPTTSLFDELFPEESEIVKGSVKKSIDKLPAFEWHDGPEIDWKETAEKVAGQRKNWFDTRSPAQYPPTSTGLQTAASPAVRQRKSELGLLTLTCASKTLEESDFFRLGSKGEHIEGWTSGILKVIQGRDTVTLEPLGHYFLIFTSEAAASAYLDNTFRLHKLSKTHGSGISPLPFPSKYLRSGEDVKQVLRGYSLMPGHSRLSLRLVSRPYSPKLAQLLSDGGPITIATKKTKSENMVLFSVNWGRIGHHDIRHAIFNDGKRRNLLWGLVDGERAIVKISGDQQNENDYSVHGGTGNRSSWRDVRTPARYILSFKDSHEARRFVREWHRRPFPVQKEHNLASESSPMMHAEMFR